MRDGLFPCSQREQCEFDLASITLAIAAGFGAAYSTFMRYEAPPRHSILHCFADS